jgi:hypothetical protein
MSVGGSGGGASCGPAGTVVSRVEPTVGSPRKTCCFVNHPALRKHLIGPRQGPNARQRGCGDREGSALRQVHIAHVRAWIGVPGQGHCLLNVDASGRQGGVERSPERVEVNAPGLLGVAL